MKTTANMNVMLSPLDQSADGWLSMWGSRQYRAGLEAGKAWVTARAFDLYDYRKDEENEVVDLIRCPALLEEDRNIFTFLHAYSLENFNQGFDRALEEAFFQNDVAMEKPGAAPSIDPTDEPELELAPALQNPPSYEVTSEASTALYTLAPDFDL